MVESPVLVQPQIERTEELVGHSDVARIEAVDPDTEGREHHRALDPLLVHHQQPGVAIVVFIPQRLQVTEAFPHHVDVAALTALGELLQSLVVRAGLANRIEGGIRDRSAHGLAEHQVTFLALRDPVHKALDFFVSMPGERIRRLVVVIVEVHEVKVERAH